MNTRFRPLLKKIQKFRDERDWMQFHNPKDMAVAITIEASEILEHFLWKNNDEISKYLSNKKNEEEVADEIADTLSFIFELADNLGIDIEEAMENKSRKNSKKYPIKKARGNATKYTKL